MSDGCPSCTKTRMHANAIAAAADRMREHEKRQDDMLRTALRERNDAREKVETLLTLIRTWAESEPPCHCGESGPCCHACRAKRELRAVLDPPPPSPLGEVYVVAYGRPGITTVDIEERHDE